LVNAGNDRRLGTDQAAELISDGGEHLGRVAATGYQRGDAPQCGLVIDKLTQPCAIGRVVARLGVGGTIRIDAGVWRVHQGHGSPLRNGSATLGARR
jgi:hypothetical protein